MSALDHPKFWIIDYYELLINEIDVRCETILMNIHLNELSNAIEMQNELNRAREQFINEIKSLQEKNLIFFERNSKVILSQFNDMLAKSDTLDSIRKTEMIEEIRKIIFSNYCFLITNNLDLMLHSNRSTRLGLKLIVCNWYLNESQIDNLRKLLSNLINEILINEVRFLKYYNIIQSLYKTNLKENLN